MLAGSPTAAAAMEVRPPRLQASVCLFCLWVGATGTPCPRRQLLAPMGTTAAGRAATQLRAEVEAAAEAVAAVTPLTCAQMKSAFSVLFSRCDAVCSLVDAEEMGRAEALGEG